MKKSTKIIIGILIAILIIGVAYILILKDVTDRANFNFKVENISQAPVNTTKVENTENSYSKTINDTKIELNIPSDWQYKELPKDEENDFYKYALKLYKNDESQYAVLYYYNNQFGVCGTGRTSKTIMLNNEKEATIGYYDGSETWSDISFYNMNTNIAVINYTLTDTQADEVIEFIKTINITD